MILPLLTATRQWSLPPGIWVPSGDDARTLIACATILLMALKTTLYSDPGCPWAYSENPALAVLRWRYDDALDWRFVAVGLAETTERYLKNGYTPARQARGWRTFSRRYGMPFGSVPRERIVATSAACRTIVATRLAHPGREVAVYRALQFAQFTTTLLFDEIDDIRTAIAEV